ncbi:MAG: ComEA family DNA-binding protein [Pseudomonadota bacterium]
MKARTLFASFLAVLTLCWANVLWADVPSDQMAVTQTVNINEADADTLAAVLDGVGLRRAEAIVLYRTQNGKFYSAEELTAVRGIGESTVARNEKKIRVE